MFTILLIAFSLQAPNCSPTSGLNHQLLQESGPVTLVRQGPALLLDLPALWAEIERTAYTGDTTEIPGKGTAYAYEYVSYHLLQTTSQNFAASVAAISPLAEEIKIEFPKDGRMVLVWCSTTGELDFQAAYDFQSAEERTRAGSLMLGDKRLCLTKQQHSGTDAGINEQGEIVFSSPQRSIDLPPAIYSAFVLHSATTMEALFEVRPQATLGRVDLKDLETPVDDTPLYRCRFWPWENAAESRTLSVAVSTDRKFWYLWYEGAEPPGPPSTGN